MPGAPRASAKAPASETGRPYAAAARAATPGTGAPPAPYGRPVSCRETTNGGSNGVSNGTRHYPGSNHADVSAATSSTAAKEEAESAAC